MHHTVHRCTLDGSHDEARTEEARASRGYRPVRDVDVSLGVSVLLRQPEIDDIDDVGALPKAHQEVIGLDVAVDEGLAVYILDPGHLQLPGRPGQA